MGVVRFFNEVRRVLRVGIPTLDMAIGREETDHNGGTPRIVMWLPQPGEETYDNEDCGTGYSVGDAVQGVLYRRCVPVDFQVWMDDGGESNGEAYPNDEEHPDEGTPWLVQTLINAIQATGTAPGSRPVSGGWTQRTTLTHGWSYVLRVMVYVPVFRTRTALDATISDLDLTCEAP